MMFEGEQVYNGKILSIKMGNQNLGKLYRIKEHRNWLFVVFVATATDIRWWSTMQLYMIYSVHYWKKNTAHYSVQHHRQAYGMHACREDAMNRGQSSLTMRREQRKNEMKRNQTLYWTWFMIVGQPELGTEVRIKQTYRSWTEPYTLLFGRNAVFRLFRSMRFVYVCYCFIRWLSFWIRCLHSVMIFFCVVPVGCSGRPMKLLHFSMIFISAEISYNRKEKNNDAKRFIVYTAIVRILESVSASLTNCLHHPCDN